MDRGAGDLWVGVEQGLGQQGANVSATQPVHHPLPLALAFDQAGEAQLGKVLAGHGRPAARDCGQAPSAPSARVKRRKSLRQRRCS